MVYTQALNTYQKTAVETVDNLKLVVMCYDAVVRDLQEAKRLHENKSMEATYDKIRHAQDIVTELLVGIDYERGGEISVNLSRLYNFILRQLIGINSRQDTSVYDSLVHIMSELRDAWEQIRRNSPHAPVDVSQPAALSWRASA